VLAVDTNIIVGYPTGDHPEQFAKARALIDGEDIFVCTTVLLETGRALGRGYHIGSEDRCGARKISRVACKSELRR